jgi:hypothetical protein
LSGSIRFSTARVRTAPSDVDHLVRAVGLEADQLADARHVRGLLDLLLMGVAVFARGDHRTHEKAGAAHS